MRREPPEIAFARIGEGWLGDEAVAGALYAFLQSPDDFEATVRHAANTPGDSDSLACIAGAIAGAYLGIYAIPERWRREIERGEELVELADALWAVAQPE